MPTIPKLVYAALLYPDGNPPENSQSDKFVEGIKADDSDNLIFSFQRPDETKGIFFTLEVFAFVKPENETEESTAIFSRESALLSGYEDDLTIEDDSDEIEVTNPIALSSDKHGSVSLKVTVPDDCSLEIKELKADGTPLDDESHFTKTGTSPNFIITQNAEKEISADAYFVKFSVKKAGEIIYVFSEYINVLNGLCTDTWDGLAKDEPKVITQNMISNTVYVRGSGDGWYKTSPYNETAVADDDINSGSFLSPLATIQKAVDKIIAINDGTSAYTICVDGTLTQSGTSPMADFSKLNQDLNLTIKSLSGTATLDANQKSRVIYAKPASGALNLTLENLVITGGKLTSENGAGIYFESAGGTLTINGGEISECTATQNGGGVYVNGGTFTMTGGTITNNEANRGGGAYVNSGTLTMSGGTISDNTASNGGGLYFNSGTFTMTDGTISSNTASYGGGVYVTNGTFTMSDNSTISNNEATGNGGGVFVNGFVDESTAAIRKGEFEMCGGTISSNTAVKHGGGIYVCSDTKNGVTASGMFTMSDSAKVAEDNDVYLSASGSNITTITIAGALSADIPVATITPSSYTENRPLLSAGENVTLNGNICNKFAVTPKNDTEWRVALDGANGVLIRKYEMGDTGPGGGAVCYYSADGFTVNGKTCHYLEGSKELVGTVSWCPCTDSSGYCDVTTSIAIGAGYANTQAILNHPNHASATASNCAAKACVEYSTDTTTAGEWFLPSHNEANQMNGVISPISSSEYLWISNIYNDTNNKDAGCMRLSSTGSSSGLYGVSKGTAYPFRAMRAF